MMSRDIGKDPNPRGFGSFVFAGSAGAAGSADWCAGAVVALVGVDGEGADDFAGGDAAASSPRSSCAPQGRARPT
jgi:hypothetical protein